MYIYLQIVSILLFFVVFISFCKNNIARILLIAFSGIYVSLEILSLLLTKNFIAYRFYFHIGIDSLEKYGSQFLYYIFAFMFSSLIICFLLYALVKFLDRFSLRLHVKFIVIVGTAIVLCSPNGLLTEKFSAFKILTAEKKTLKAALTDLGVPPGEYVFPEELDAQPGKNIIVISVESLELGFLKTPFEKITPNLRGIAEDWTFFENMPEGPGGSWTAGALYKQQVGIPAYFDVNDDRHNGNDLFQKTDHFQLTSLGLILKEAGYESLYLIGHKEFAGTEDLLSSFQIPVVSEKNSLRKYRTSPNGFYDHDLFAEAKARIEQLLGKDEASPFAVFMSTADTHFPNGTYDRRMRKHVSTSSESRMEFSVATVDYLIRDFMTYLRDKGLLENTAVFIFPDHLMMGSGKVVETLSRNNRQLYLITNASEEKLGKKESEKIYQVDIPRIILDGSGVKTNATFLVDFIRPKNVIDFIGNRKAEIASLNMAAQKRVRFEEGVEVSLDKASGLLAVGWGETFKKFSVNLQQSLSAYDVVLSKNMGFIKKKSPPFRDAYSVDIKDIVRKRLHVIVELKEGNISRAYLGDKMSIGMYKEGDYIIFNKDDIHEIVALKNKQYSVKEKEKKKSTVNRNVELGVYSNDTNRFIAHAGGEIGGLTYTNSLEAMNQSYNKGFRMFELDISITSDNVFVAAHGWDHWARLTEYVGRLPPPHEVFMQQKIGRRYSPLSIKEINEWFAAHLDAMLVTDKIRTPLEFAAKFIDKSRLMMELFDWEAVFQAQRAGVKALPSENLVYSLNTDRIHLLTGMGIESVATSYRIINTHPQLVEALQENGIKIYGYHINFDDGFDEKYIACKERDRIFGIYADIWNFDAPPKCSD